MFTPDERHHTRTVPTRAGRHNIWIGHGIWIVYGHLWRFRVICIWTFLDFFGGSWICTYVEVSWNFHIDNPRLLVEHGYIHFWRFRRTLIWIHLDISWNINMHSPGDFVEYGFAHFWRCRGTWIWTYLWRFRGFWNCTYLEIKWNMNLDISLEISPNLYMELSG